MSAMTAVTLCPISSDSLPAIEPTSDTLSYSLTLPAAPASAAMARAATRAALDLHGLGDATEAVVQTVSELVACACRFSAADDIYVSLRHRDGTVRVIAYDSHPRHTHPRLSAVCDARRKGTLRVLAAVVRACGGTWGFDAARQPSGGTRMWAVLPTSGARAYGRGR
ncbi:ATP-binding protein [Streptomyces cellulosae]|jgi:anti-sigma regulatory factor (Ser/Thr protein kinase)|uniref:ATP-binding protein n=3 Tax=Streptomyces TaxID=1883 RepID=A0ABU3JAF6_9ACTN|nr:anti-sigma regulatory factor (Ser/Thr protein kinase) [Streptomyces thermodiastaticus]MDT6972039.1 ATP-binding protein [Streptomyces thermocarboxydus]WSB43061.1 ATP-binding protein [Streptomyces cellulosae]WSB92824.1 ATP-binding protein [Streptomyces cellulosae]WTF22064.1 ATP-binding protein [Streptomyces cellulosae]